MTGSLVKDFVEEAMREGGGGRVGVGVDLDLTCDNPK